MRGYAKVPANIWPNDLKKLRGDPLAIAVHYYLTTNPHSTMIGLYHCPIMFIAYELGCPLEGASKGLQRVIQASLASYDQDSEYVWVHDMAAMQIAERLSPKDKQVAGVVKQLLSVPISSLSLGFYRRYRDAFCLGGRPELTHFERAYQGPLKPLRSKEQEQEQEKEQDQGAGELAPEKESLASAHARDDDEYEPPFDPEPTVEQARARVIALGVPGRFQEAAIYRLQSGVLFPCDIREWKREAA